MADLANRGTMRLTVEEQHDQIGCPTVTLSALTPEANLRTVPAAKRWLAARGVSVSARTITRQLVTGKLGFILVGDRRLIPEAYVISYLERGLHPATNAV